MAKAIWLPSRVNRILAPILILTIFSNTLLAQTYELEWALEPSLSFFEVWSFKNGRAKVRIADDNGNFPVGFVDKRGLQVIPCQYERSNEFSEGVAWVVNYKGENALINENGRIVIPFKDYYTASGDFSEGLCRVQIYNESTGEYLFGLVDKADRVVVPFKYWDLGLGFSEGLMKAELQGVIGYIDRTGYPVIPFQYYSARNFSEGLAAVETEESPGWGFINKTGKSVIPYQFKSVGSFSEGLAEVQLAEDGNWGFIDKAGRLVVNCQYESTSNFSYGVAWVSQNDLWGLIDKTGRQITPFQYTDFVPFYEGLSAVKRDGKWGFVDKNGKEAIPCTYNFDYINEFSDGVAWAGRNGKDGILYFPRLVTPAPGQASTARRLALVMGNEAYINGTQLKNPVNDAKAVSTVLKSVGFEVIMRTNLGEDQMEKVIDDFGAKLSGYDVGLVYYSGHGLQSKGNNYLIPIDASLNSESDVEYECIDANSILAKLEDAGTKANIIMFDACRVESFKKPWRASEGLVAMPAPPGTLLSFATSPGKPAYDGRGTNSPYAKALVRHLPTSGIEIMEMFRRVRRDVMQETNGTDNVQVPWEHTSIPWEFFFKR